jgi:hypothetical protein
MKVEVLGPIPIPVGHRVRVRWFRKKVTGLFGGVTTESHPTQPQVEDLDTGIVHSFDWQYKSGGRVQEKEGDAAEVWPSRFREVLDDGIEEERTALGRVTGCRIFTSVSSGHLAGTCFTQTELTLAPEEGGEPYR